MLGVMKDEDSTISDISTVLAERLPQEAVVAGD
jgi:hypothetical protein